MWEWLDELWMRINGNAGRTKRRLLHRKFHLSGAVAEWLQSPERTHVQRLAFAELLLKLESDPSAHSVPILQKDAPPGMRWAPFGAHKAIFIWSPAENQIRVLTCV